MIADLKMPDNVVAEKIEPDKAIEKEKIDAKNAEVGSKPAAGVKAEPEKAAAEAKAAPKPKKRRRLKVAHPERCIGCLGCMFACSRIHAGTASLQDSAIKVLTRGGIEGDFVVVVCRGCENPPCVKACPAGALERKPDGRVVFHEELCTGCAKCEEACLIGAISLGKTGKPIKCMHCGACVAFCPHGVLELEEVPA